MDPLVAMTPKWSEVRFGSIPQQLTSFVGRRSELRALRKRIGESRLVTLTGPGGIGKTRLAIELVRTIAGRWPDGALWVDLTTVDDSSQVAEAVAAALHLPGHAPPVVRVVAWLTPQEAMLLLDNCEHVVSGCAELCREILENCPDVTIIATSREPLGVPGEARRPVLSLSDDDAIALFEQRGRLVAPDFATTASNRGTVLEICSRLDALPLAIELAASRLGVMTELEISAQLERQPGLLSSSRPLNRRHQTMTSTIDWSYRLLSPSEAALFGRLAVFHGGFTLESAQAVCSAEVLLDVFKTLVALVDKSMVVAEKLDDGSTRYRLLELQAAYARDRLAETGELDEIQRRHYGHFADTCEARLGRLDQPVPQTYGPADATWKRRERPNLWAAMRWARNSYDDHGLELACMFQRGVQMDQWQHLDWLRDLMRELPMDRPIASARHPGMDLRFHALSAILSLTSLRGDFPRALDLARQRLALVTAHAGDRSEEMRVQALIGVAGSLMSLRRLDEAQALADEAWDLALETGNQSLIAAVMHNRGHLARRRGQPDVARELFTRELALHESISNAGAIARAHESLAAAELECGDLDGAEANLEVTVRWALTMDAPYAYSDCLELLSRLATLRGRHARALRLAAAKLRANEVLGGDEPYSRDLLTQSIEHSRASLGPKKSDDAWNQGWAMDLRRAAEYALEPETDREPDRRGPLSRRELEVVRLVAAGMTNRQVAARLFLSERTVEGHLDRIRNKLDLRSRAEVGAWAAGHDLVDL